MATLRQVSGGAPALATKFQEQTANAPADLVRADLPNAFNDITTGALANQTLTGPTRTFTGGQPIRIMGWASAAGTLIIETSSDGGTTWPNSDSEPIAAGTNVQGICSTLPAANRYRLRFVCGPAAASRVSFSTQARA